MPLIVGETMQALIIRFLPYIFLAIVSLFIFDHYYRYIEGFNDGKQNIEYKTLTKTVAIKDKMDEIRNNKPDSTGVVKRLLDGSF